MKYVVMGVAFALVATTPVLGQQSVTPAPGGTSAQAPAQKKPDAKRKVCRRVETTGSIMRETICRTQDQWAAEEKASGDNAEQMRNSQRNGSQTQ